MGATPPAGGLLAAAIALFGRAPAVPQVTARLTWADVEDLGPDVAEHFALLASGKAAVRADDPMWVDLIQFILRRVVEIHSARAGDDSCA